MAERCPNPRPDCPYRGTRRCILTRHHLYFPERDYPTRLEQRFRNLSDNIVLLPWCDHQTLHVEEEPPRKPSQQEMLRALGRVANAESEMGRR